MELTVIKNDVVGELRMNRYFNEIEITRLVQSNEMPHRDRVLHIVQLTRENANINEALRLTEAYFPAQQQQQQIQPEQPTA